VDDMVKKTSTPEAPWHLVPSVDKKYARVHVLRTVCDALEIQLRKRARSRVWDVNHQN
jgi:polyphosphate kinase 2 (PPK2 family)